MKLSITRHIYFLPRHRYRHGDIQPTKKVFGETPVKKPNNVRLKSAELIFIFETDFHFYFITAC